MEDYELETDRGDNIQHLYNLSVFDEEYDLSMSINESFLEFKL